MTQETPYGAAFVRSALLTRREAAVYLGVSEQTLAIWKCTGRYNLPYIKIGRLVKYKLTDLDAFIARNHKTASA
ncbi:MAG: DNA-binding protein [Cyanobacteria bacterium PR.3.49]|nr:DNA-binding protein [Cyanobacteria bacterium PR.3.49]